MGLRLLSGLRPHCPSVLMLTLGSLVLLLNAAWAESQDYYKLLAVSREANTREIRQAFKKLALTMHPDKNPVSGPKMLLGYVKAFNVASDVCTSSPLTQVSCDVSGAPVIG